MRHVEHLSGTEKLRGDGFFIYDPRKAIRAFGLNLPGAGCSVEGHHWSRTPTAAPPKNTANRFNDYYFLWLMEVVGLVTLTHSLNGSDSL